MQFAPLFIIIDITSITETLGADKLFLAKLTKKTELLTEKQKAGS